MLFGLIATILSDEASAAAGRAKRTAVLYLLAGILAVTALGFFVGAGYVATQRRLGSLEASLAFGGGFLLLAIVLLVVQRIAAAAAKRRAAERRRKEMREFTIAATSAILGSRGGVFSALGASALAGIVLSIMRESRGRDRDD